MRRIFIYLALIALVAVGVIWVFVLYDRKETDPNDVARCDKPPGNAVTTIESGLKPDVIYKPETAVMVEIGRSQRDTAGWPQALLGMQVTGANGTAEIAIWGIGNPQGLVLPITSLNQGAILNSSWGTQQGDHAADANRQFASSLMEQNLLTSCVTEKVNTGS